MNHTENQYWKSIEEREQDPQLLLEQDREFAEDLPVEALGDQLESFSMNRRDFLKMAGFGLSAAALASCSKMPVQKALPYVVQPEDVIPGVANYYASTSAATGENCSIVVKTRESHPIKIEGNKKSSLNGPGISAVDQASLLSLYDSSRIQKPSRTATDISWEELDQQVIKSLESAQSQNKKIRILSGTINSPSTSRVIQKFKEKYSNTEHIQWDPISYSAIRKANKQSFGPEVLPHYRFDLARTIVSVGADFLGTWIAPIEFSKQWAQGRKLNKNNKKAQLSRHIQIEAGMSLTGTNADQRLQVKDSDYGLVLVDLYAQLQQYKSGQLKAIATTQSTLKAAQIHEIAEQLFAQPSKSLLVSSSNKVEDQILVNAINSLLANIGSTIDLSRPSQQGLGDEAQLETLVTELEKEEIGVLILYHTNPLYASAFAKRFNRSGNMPTVISFGAYKDETNKLVMYQAPDHHFLEAWNDYEPVKGSFSIGQPTMVPIYDTRAAQESLLKWAGVEQPNYYDEVRNTARDLLFPKQSKHARFESFWNEFLQTGAQQLGQSMASSYPFIANAQAAQNKILATKKSDSLELVLYEKIGLRDGRDANNPWLQELPDPVTKVTWSNYASIAPSLAKKENIEDGDILKISAGKFSEELPAFIQPGQNPNSISVALGYGRSVGGKVIESKGIGVNVYPFLQVREGQTIYSVDGVKISKTGAHKELAQTQTHHSLKVNGYDRPIVRETTLAKYQKNPAAGNESHLPEPVPSLYPKRDDSTLDQGKGHAWGMSIDLNACTGCGACVIGCQAENNVPVVGEDEVRRRREMHWIRIDRYYRGSEDNPETVHQPMLCQHCGNAPCENVCPVIATMHSNDGLNAQAYNRCVGTRYCANNCPYKVRRFNWFNYSDNQKFDYNMNDQLGKLVLNPDVSVRTRGVMEKCSMCVQRIQEGKLNAKLKGEELQDGAIQTACQQSCPTQAISFGDMNNTQSEVTAAKENKRDFTVLEELNVRPIVSYLTKVRNKD